MYSRRTFVKSGAAAIAAMSARMSMAAPTLVDLGRGAEPVPPVQDYLLKEQLQRAVDVARRAGATYADAFFSHDRNRSITPRYDGFGTPVFDNEYILVSVRALVGGYWGFAAAPALHAGDPERLAREAVSQARANRLSSSRTTELVPNAVHTGHWTMPVRIDPFTVPPTEVIDYLNAIELYIHRTPGTKVRANSTSFTMRSKAFASTEGSYCTQQLYRTSGSLDFTLRLQNGDEPIETVPNLSNAGLGWELYLDQPLRQRADQIIERMREDAKLPVKAVDPGRYDILLSAPTIADVLGKTLGVATQLDRVMGYEANAGGTSYITNPLEELGTMTIGAPLLTVTANRSEPGAVSTVRWDDEGVTPDAFTLVQDGRLVDLQTTRESASWLRSYYERSGRAVRSHGCAFNPGAGHEPLTFPPNLTMTPASGSDSFEMLLEDLGDGFAARVATAGSVDFQALNGLITAVNVYEVKRGKKVGRVNGMILRFRAPEFWKSLQAIGGQGSEERYGMTIQKGQPERFGWCSITAVPALCRQLAVFDVARRV